MLCYLLTISTPEELALELQYISCDSAGIAIMQEKLSCYTIKITELKGYCALALKETALSAGAECALPRKTIRAPEELVDVILLCTREQLKTIYAKCAKQAFKQLHELSTLLLPLLRTKIPAKPKLMGILNVTPDSFSDGGTYMTIEAAITHALEMIAAGVTIIDVGGESTRPGAAEISAAEEINRVIPVITAIHQKAPQIIISIDTTKGAVARAAIDAGATMINDISGLTNDPEIARVAADSGAQLVLMHRLAPSTTMQDNPQYTDIIKELLQALSTSIALAKNAGVADHKIIIDPGIGFGKTTKHNLYILRQLSAFYSLGYPVMLGASRKSVIGNVLHKEPAERILGTAILSALTYPYADYLRVHDIAENHEALVLAEAIRL